MWHPTPARVRKAASQVLRATTALINTLLQRGVRTHLVERNCFNSFTDRTENC